jgi:hypothetical protein
MMTMTNDGEDYDNDNNDCAMMMKMTTATMMIRTNLTTTMRTKMIMTVPVQILLQYFTYYASLG